MADPKWLTLMRSYIGLKETPGAADNPKIMEWSRISGATIRHDSDPWCAVGLNGILTEAGERGTMSPAARSFLNWGQKLNKPKPGAIMVFKRGNSSWQGHVGLYVGETATHYNILGANQGDAVKIAPYAKADLLGIRWPSTVKGSRTIKAQVAGLVSTGVAAASEVAPQVQTLSDTATSFWEWAGYISLACMAVSIACTVYFRIDDMRKKGR